MKFTEFKEDKEESNLNSWMDNVVSNTSLPNNKGVIAKIQAPQKITTKYGERYSCQFVINGKDGSTINVKVFLPEQFPYVHPKSNLGKMMKKYECKQFSELIGKEIEVIEPQEGMWKIAV